MIGFLIMLSRMYPFYYGKPISLFQIPFRQAYPVESEIVKVVFPRTTEITDAPRLKTKKKNPKKTPDLQGLNTSPTK